MSKIPFTSSLLGEIRMCDMEPEAKLCQCVSPEHNTVVQPLLTDLYQITMAYAYWHSNKCSDYAVFDLFFRKNPFDGEFVVFAGLEECINFLKSFRYSDSDIEYLKKNLLTTVDPAFFEFLSKVTAKDVKLYSVPEGTVVFPRVPLLRVEGPLAVAQLLETTLLTLVNYASLVATNATRFKMAAGPNIELLEFGLRRAQGPDGGLSASKYAYIGGFHGTSNVLAGKLYGIPVKGTHAHAFIMSFSSLADCKNKMLKHVETGKPENFVRLCLKRFDELSQFLHILSSDTNTGEFAAFISYAVAFPENFLALIDTYDVIRSGLLNFCAVALALHDLGYKAIGIRIDSGDLAYLSIVSRETFHKIAVKYKLPWFEDLYIVASNDINEDILISLNEQKISFEYPLQLQLQTKGIKEGHKINCFGIGTHLVTCQKQPALGCVFKLVEVNGSSCIKLSLNVEKITIPGKKYAYRLYGKDGYALIDLLQRENEPPPKPRKRILCRHPFEETKRVYVLPEKVINLNELYWSDGNVCQETPPLSEVRNRVENSLSTLRQDIKRNLNPTPYKISVSQELYSFMHQLWSENAPIGELS